MTNDLASPADLTGFPGAPFDGATVDAAVAALRGAAGWHIAPSRTETLTLDVEGGTRVVLPSLYVTDVTAVRDVCSTSPVEITDYRWSGAGILSHRWRCWPYGFQALEVDLTHGYSECPADLLPSIAAACAALVSAGVASRTIGPFSETYRDTGNAGPFGADPVVARYSLPPRP